MTPELESLCTARPVEIRSATERRAKGYAAVFNTLSRDFGGWRELIEPSFFNKSFGDTGFRDVVCKYEHRDLLGTKRAGTLDVRTDSTGLPFEVQIPRTRDDVYELIDRGDIGGASFAFRCHQDTHRMDRSGVVVRHLISGSLNDVSIVADPAYDAATVSVRSFASHSFAQQFDADVSEVQRDFQNGELRRYFADDRDPVYIDMAPTPLAVAERSHGGDLDLRRKRLESQAKKIAMDTGHRPDEPRQLSVGQRLLLLHRRKSQWDAPAVEVRSLPVGDFDRFGNPARRNSNGHAID
jgi:HK97 family phage prohead protease